MIINKWYEIKTPDGYMPFKGIQKVKKTSKYFITFSNGDTIECSIEHPWISNNTVYRADELVVGDPIDTADGNFVTIIDIQQIDDTSNLYDIIGVDGKNIFEVNGGLLSHNCDFISSGHTVVDGETLRKYELNNVKEPIEKRGIDKELWIWKYPDYTHDYVVCADVSRGDSTDYSAFHVIDVETLEQVAEYRGMMPTQDYGNFMVNVATEYNEALLVIENANVGWAAIQPAIDRDYKNLYYSNKDTQVIDSAVMLNKGYDLKDKSQMVAGFTMSSKTRPMVISKLERYFREESVIVNSKRLIDELYVFIWQNGRPEAANGYNDDLVMSFAIGMWVRDTALRLKQEGLQLTKKSIESITRTTSNDQAMYNSNRMHNDPWNMKINGRNFDLRWMID